MDNKETTIPFGAFDSELHYHEINIPDGCEATIKDGKIIIRKIESEDERIRKALIRYHKSTIDIDGIKGNEIVAWLEKQGKTDKIVERAKIEKQRVLVTESDGVANIDWDTRSFEDARKLLECGLDYVNKLEKQGEKKSAEWSEEDEKMYRGVMAVCDVCSTATSFYPKENEDVERLKNWLKSLKDRNLWKPSDEQITVLELASKYERVFTHKQIDILIDLKEQLKKLKGE